MMTSSRPINGFLIAVMTAVVVVGFSYLAQPAEAQMMSRGLTQSAQQTQERAPNQMAMMMQNMSERTGCAITWQR